MRGTLPDTLNIKDLPPLKCKTDKICVTNKMFGKGDCKDSFGDSYTTIRVSSDKAKAEEEIKKILADSLAECWSMMGEGKIQVFEREVFSSKKKCVVCSRIDFDKNVDVKEINGLFSYLNKNLPGKDISYWQFLTNSKVSDSSLSQQKISKLSTSEKAIVFIEIDNKNIAETSAMLTGGLVGTVFGGTKGAVIGSALGYQINDVLGDVVGAQDYLTSIYIADYTSENIKTLDCDSLESIS